MNVTTTSKQFTLGWRDAIKGLVVAVLTAVITIIADTIGEGSLTFDWALIGKTALTAALAYVMKNFFTPSTIQVNAPKEVVQQVHDGDKVVKVGNTEAKLQP